MADDTFPGFRRPDTDFIKFPNEYMDIIAKIDSLSELKIILYVIRHTWGFQEYGTLKLFSTDEFEHGRKRKDGTRMDEGTGLGLTAIKEGIAKAVKHGYIVCDIDARDKARIKKYYGLKMLETSDKSDGRNPTPDSHNPTVDSRKATIRETESNYRTERKIPLKELPEKDTSKTESTNPAHDPPNNTSLTLSSSEEQMIYDFYCEIGAVVKLSETAKKHCAELAPHIHSLDDMKALYAFVLPKIYGDDKTVYLGNMVRYLKPWLQSKAPEPPAKPRTGVRNFTQERVERERLAKQQAANEQKEVKI